MEAEGEQERAVNKMKKRKYVIEDVILKNNTKIEPLLVDFANGQPLEGADFTGALHRSTGKQVQKSHSILTIQTPKLSYAGTETDTLRPSGVSTFLGLIDKSTGKMRLVEVSQFTLQPVIQSVGSVASATSPEDMTYDEKQEAIAATFGSRKAKLAVNRKQQNKVEAESMSGAIELTAAASGVSTAMVEHYIKEQQEASLLGILPPCHRDATKIEDVYRLEELAPDDFLLTMQESAQALLANKQDTGSTNNTINSSLLFREMVENARFESKYAKQQKFACVALLVKHLLAFLACRDKRIKEFSQGKHMDDPCKRVVTWIVQEYSQKQGKLITRSSKDEDRALCYTLILAFISNKYELSVSTLLQSLPVKKERLGMLMKVIGATYNPPTYSFKLKLPLAKLNQGNKKNKKTRKR